MPGILRKIFPCFFAGDNNEDGHAIEMSRENMVTAATPKPAFNIKPSAVRRPTHLPSALFVPNSTNSAQSERDQSNTITPISKTQSIGSSSKPGSDQHVVAASKPPDADEIAPVPPPGSMQNNVASALEDRRKLFERLRTAPVEAPTNSSSANPTMNTEIHEAPTNSPAGTTTKDLPPLPVNQTPAELAG